MKPKRQEARLVASGIAIAGALALGTLAPAGAAWTRIAADGLMIAAALCSGVSIAARAMRALLRRDVSIEMLVTIAALGAIVIGEMWEAAAVTFLFALGHALEARALQRTRGSVAGLMALLPTEVRVRRGGRDVRIAPHEVVRGDLVVVQPGDRIPVDGPVLTGRAAVDESTLTGESVPVVKEPGSQTFTGTTTHGYLEIRADAVGADTTLARIVQRVEEAQEAKPARQRFLERFARVYTPAVVAGSAVAYAVSTDVHLALTLLVIACPGALVIATPVAMVAGIGRAARAGVLLKGGEPLESLARIRTVAFDKTGTLTRGRPVVEEVITPGMHVDAFQADGSPREPLPDPVREALMLAAQAEHGSEHPFADAIRAATGHVELNPPQAFEAVVGRGTRSRIDGREVLVGSPAFLESAGVVVQPAMQLALDALGHRGRSIVGLAVDGEFNAWIGLGDEVRPHAREALVALRRIGVRRLVMLTGDHARVAEAVAADLHLDCAHADLLPEDKVALVASLAERAGTVAMVGDGVNDAIALARADVGIAMGAAGTRAAFETAGVVVMGDDLRVLPKAISLARQTTRVERQNLAVALGTVAILVPGVLMGSVHMAGGMLVHQASVLLVILNALRLARPSADASALGVGRPPFEDLTSAPAVQAAGLQRPPRAARRPSRAASRGRCRACPPA